MYYRIKDFEIIDAGKSVYADDCLYSDVDFEDFQNNQGKYIIDKKDPNSKLILNPEYEAKQAQERQKQFNDNFVITSWGAFRKTPQGYSSAVEAVNTIFNMVNIAQGLTESLAPLLIFYEVPDFTDPEQCTEEWLIANQKTHESCDLATFMQWYLEFQTIWAQTQYTSQNVPLSL